MSWFKKKRSLRISPILLADQLYQILVEENDPQAAPQAAPEKYHLPAEVHERFRQKVFLYREANVLSALLDWAKEDPALFEQPLQEYERILFPQSPGTPAAPSARLLAVRAAMADLQELFQLTRQGGGQLSWSKKWFADIGRDETNPVTLVLLSTFWLDLHIAVQKSLNAIGGRSPKGYGSD